MAGLKFTVPSTDESSGIVSRRGVSPNCHVSYQRASLGPKTQKARALGVRGGGRLIGLHAASSIWYCLDLTPCQEWKSAYVLLGPRTAGSQGGKRSNYPKSGCYDSFPIQKFLSHGICDTDHNTIRRTRSIRLFKNWKLVCSPFWTLPDASTNLADSCASMTSETSRRERDLQPCSRSVDGCRLKRVPRIDRHAAHVNTRNRSQAQQSHLSKSCADQCEFLPELPNNFFADPSPRFPS